MRAQFTASRMFGCATRPEPGSGSDRLNSKTIRISASVAGEAMTSFHAADEALGELAAELSGRILEDMMPGAATTTLGIAAWAMERLALRLPKLTRLEVTDYNMLAGSDCGVVLERSPNTGV